MKKKIIISLIIIISLSFIFLILSNKALKPTYSTSCALLGDINSDGIINNDDAKLIARYIIGENITGNTSCADVNQDGIVKMNDVLWIIKGKIVNPVEVTGITLKAPTDITEYYINGEYTFTATITPSNAADKTITWTSSNPNVATIKNGKVTTIANGSTTITATTNNNKKATLTINVMNPYIKSDTYPLKYKDGSAELTIEYKSYRYSLSHNPPLTKNTSLWQFIVIVSAVYV